MTRSTQHTSITTRAARIAASGALALAVSITLPAPSAWAHAGMNGSNPRDGAVLTTAPRTVTLNFTEKVTFSPANIQLLNSSAGKVTARVTSKLASGASSITLTTAGALPPGMYAARYAVTSADGHLISGAIAFTVRTPTPAATAQARTLSNGVKATLSGGKIGSRTLTFVTSAKTGSVELTHPSLGAPLRWTVKGNGKVAKASGVLPFAGSWTVNARLRVTSYSDSTGSGTFSITR